MRFVTHDPAGIRVYRFARVGPDGIEHANQNTKHNRLAEYCVILLGEFSGSLIV